MIVQKKQVYNPDTTEKINEAYIFGGSPSGILNFTKSTNKWALDIWNGMEANTWFPKEANTSRDKEPYSQLSDGERRMFDLALAQLIFNDSEQSNNLMDNINPYITDPIVNSCLARQSYEECLVGETEVLTPSGWVRLDAYDGSSKVLQVSLDKLESSFIKPSKLISNYREGFIDKYEGRKFSQFVTQGHRIPFRDRRGVNQVKLSEDFTIGKQGLEFLVSTNKKGKLKSLTPYERFLIALQADGTIFRESIDSSGNIIYRNRNGKRGFISCSFSFSKQRKIKRFKEIISLLGFSMYESPKDLRGRYTFSVKVPTELYPTKLFKDWVTLEDISKEWAEEFLLELKHWDGWDYGDTSFGYDTSVSENADSVEMISCLSGISCSRRLQEDKRGYKAMHRFTFKRGYDYVSRGSVSKTQEPFKGLVYCLEVPEHFFLIRHNGKISVTGNCNHSKSYAVMAEDISVNTDEIYNMYKKDPILAKKNKAIADMYSELPSNTPTEMDIMRAFIANNILEGIVFFGGFVSLWSLGNKMVGSAKMISFIARDEAGTHLPLFGNMFQTSLKQRPYLDTEELKKVAYNMIDTFVNLEIEWTKYITDGKILGFSEESIIRYCKYRGNVVCENLGYPRLYEVERSPLQNIEDSYCDFNTTRTNFFEGDVVNYSKGSLELDF